MAVKLLVISAALAFLCCHTPFASLATAVLLYMFIWLAERLYRVFILLAKALCLAYVAFLFIHSLTVRQR